MEDMEFGVCGRRTGMAMENARSVTMFRAVLRYPSILICLTVQQVPLTVGSHIMRISVHCSSTVNRQPKV